MKRQRALFSRVLSVFLVPIIGAAGAYSSLTYLVETEHTLSRELESDSEVLYMPNGEALEFMSFGYRNALANLLWFKTISYFGKHHATDQNYRWLAHQCDLVTKLTPLASHAYTFCSNMLSWEVGTPLESLQILNRAVRHFPNDWLMLYYRGITRLVFLKDPALAAEDFRLAAKLPEAPPLVARLAAKTLAELDQPEAATRFLKDLLELEMDPHARRALEEKLRALEESAPGRIHADRL